jgi:hypothetical protein
MQPCRKDTVILSGSSGSHSVFTTPALCLWLLPSFAATLTVTLTAK